MVRSGRLLIVAGYVAAVHLLVVTGLSALLGPGEVAVLLPFAAAAVAVAALRLVVRGVDRTLGRLAPDGLRTPYSTLAETAARVRAGSVQQAMPGLARTLAEGTGARRAVLWLAVEDELVRAATHPPDPDPMDQVAAPRTVANLAVLLARPDTDHVVPVLDGSVLRAALAIGKAGRPLTASDRQLMQDVANGAGLLLRGVALNAELQERVRRAEELAAELTASRRRLTQAREVERRRLITELSDVTTHRLSELRAGLADAAEFLADREAEEARDVLGRSRVDLDELIEQFRAIARGVYPSVLRDQGPAGALDELAADLPRPVVLSGSPVGRLPWEVESGIYYLAASALRRLAGRPGSRPLQVRLEHADGRLSVRIDDPTPTATSPDEVRAGLADDLERLSALGGDLEVVVTPDGGSVLRAWLPDQLEPAVDRGRAR